LVATELLLVGVVVLWLFNPALFAGLAMRSVTSPGPPPFEWLTRYLFLAQWLGRTTRSLDAWLLRHRTPLTEQCFATRESVRSRTHYADVFQFAAITGWTHEVQTGRRAAV